MKTLRLLAAATMAAATWPALAVGHLAHVSVVDRVTHRTLPVHWHEGRAYVVGTPSHEYQVIVKNRGHDDLLAVVSVDGVNALSGETATAQQGGYVVAPGQRVEVRGWRKSFAEIAAFYFTSLGDSYAARTERPDNVGVIGVAIFKRGAVLPAAPAADAAPWRNNPGEKRSVESSASAPAVGIRRLLSDPAAPLGTGHGRREGDPMQWVPFERATREPAETLSIRYDSYRNLVALGVLEARHAPRQPRPFPGFVPDPPPSAYF